MELLESLQSISVHSVLIFISIVLYLIYIYRAKFNYWADRGVASQTPLQSLRRVFRLHFRLDSFTTNYLSLYRSLDGLKYGGSFELAKPQLMIRDPEIIKMVLIKGFQNFHDRVSAPDEKLDPISTTLFNLCGEKWRQVRHKVASGFSSAKLKIMFQSLKECVQEMDSYLETLLGEEGAVEVDTLELMSNYTFEVIGACTMGVRCNSIRGGDTEFKRITRGFFTFDTRRMVYTLLELIHPKLPALVGWKQVSLEVEDFFLGACKEVAALKESEAATRKDFLQIMMDVQNAERKEVESKRQVQTSENAGIIFSDNLMAGVIASFFSAGFEPTAATLTFCIYELALNPHVQEKLFTEIQAVKSKVGNEIEYETLKEFKYVGQVIDETLRKYPASGILARICTESFKLPDSSLVIEKNVKIFISIYGLHMDPQYFPDPEKFDPDRFSEENRENIVPGTYLPFGDGPRTCIALRLALMDIKTMLIHLVSNYIIQPTTETPKKVTFDTDSFTVFPVEKISLRLQKRK